jgi:acyl-CoA thioesterase
MLIMPSRFIDHVGLQTTPSASGTGLLYMDIQAFHYNTNGVVHGGALFTLADTGMGMALYEQLAPDERCATIDIKINYLRPVTGGRVVCTSTVVHKGRSTAYLECTLTANDKLVARASGTFAIFVPEPAPTSSR